MAGCCDPSGYKGVFNKKEAERRVRNFLKRGLDSTARPMIDELRSHDLAQASVIEVGAGSGTAVVSLLDAGAERATAFDISPAYEHVAMGFLAKRGYEGRVEWHTGDFVAAAGDVSPAEVVFLNRVVCCYPDMPELVDAAAGRCTRMLAMAYPRNTVVMRALIRLLNGWLRIRRNTFRVFVHDPERIGGRVRHLGLEEVASGSTPGWEWHVWERAA